MKILHLADLHLGVKNNKLPKEKQEILKDETLESCRYLFLNIAKKFDVVLICGDLFHSKSVSNKIVDFFFANVKQYGKPVLYINGNHDEKLELVEIPENFIILDHTKSKHEMEDFVFYSVEYNQDIDKTKNNILLLHGNIESSKDNDYVDINHYLAKNYDYIALGHTHTVKKYKKGNSIFAYSGSLFSNGFDECGDKGYIEVEINNKKVEKCEFKVLPNRSYVICECDITDAKSNGEIANMIRTQIALQGKSEKDIVRVVLKGYYDEFLNKSIASLQEQLQDFFYLEILDNSKLKIDVESLKKETLSLKNEFISLVENSLLDENIKQQIIKLGIEALKGDELSI